MHCLYYTPVGSIFHITVIHQNPYNLIRVHFFKDLRDSLCHTKIAAAGKSARQMDIDSLKIKSFYLKRKKLKTEIEEGKIPETIQNTNRPQIISNIPGLGLCFIHKLTGTFYLNNDERNCFDNFADGAQYTNNLALERDGIRLLAPIVDTGLPNSIEELQGIYICRNDFWFDTQRVGGLGSGWEQSILLLGEGLQHKIATKFQMNCVRNMK